MTEFKNEYLCTPTPVTPRFLIGQEVAYSPHEGMVMHGIVVEEASEHGRYIVRFADRTRAINARCLVLANTEASRGA